MLSPLKKGVRHYCAAPVIQETESTLRKAVLAVATLNFLYFGVEFSVGLSISSVSLFADSIDFLEDTFVNLLIFLALGWGTRNRALAGMLLAAMLLVPSAATVWVALEKFRDPSIPAALPLSLAGVGALIVNLSCAFILARFRNLGGSLAKAAFLSARNDALANVAIIIAAVLTLAAPSHWPDMIVGMGIFFMNLDAAREVYSAARAEHSKK